MERSSPTTVVKNDARRKYSDSTSDDRCSALEMTMALNASASSASTREMITYPLMVRRYEASSRLAMSQIARMSGRLLFGRGVRRARGELEEDGLQPVADPVQAEQV